MRYLQTHIQLENRNADTILARWLGRPVHCQAVRRLGGGMINSVCEVRFNCPPYVAVVKMAADEHHGGFAKEEHKLSFFRTNTRFPCPEPYWLDVSRETLPFSYLVIEKLPGMALCAIELSPEEKLLRDTDLAETLADLHSHTGLVYGDIDGTHCSERWSEVMLRRLMRLRERICDRVTPWILSNVDRAINAVTEVFADQGTPTLIHGDIWAGNILMDRRDGVWRISGIVDLPAAEYADPERELAYLQAFHTVSRPFFDVYAAMRPLRPGYRFRRMYYWLETYMLHVDIFGDTHYHNMLRTVAGGIVAFLKHGEEAAIADTTWQTD